MADQHDLITAEVHPKATRSKPEVKAFRVSRDIGEMFNNIPRQSPGDAHVPISPIGGTSRGGTSRGLASHGPEVVIECCCEGRDGVVRSGGRSRSLEYVD